MAQGINSVVIVGNLTRDIELRHTGSGTAVANMGVAVNERIKQGDDWTDYASFFDVTLWGRKAETAAEHIGKGSPVAVSGNLRQERWEKDGQTRSKVVIVARDVQFLPSKGQGGGGGGGSSYKEEAPDFDPGPQDIAAGGGSDDDIPF